ncbi:hypothetical protein [Aquimarina brevivitae]|uniref:Lipoprotein n=1 Tax=Aquimarina brevivitae TaxID=323412 RepID=A0A4Q7PET0_9FLAO|nr:hypothetical protein [Aquimarina brevivitae]RZS98805.1 hypothetical protein EV197_0005 [Aquimarina brevivitae]
MNYIRFGYCILMMLVLSGCSILQPKDATPTYTPKGDIAVLGAIGTEDKQLLATEFTVNALPQYLQGIRVYATAKPFNKNAYKKLLKSPEATKVPVKYVDSIPNKPNYLQLQLIDRIAVLEALKTSANSSIANYIETQNDSRLVSAITVVFPKTVQDEILKADALFLQNNRYKQYELALVKDGNRVQQISLQEAVVFDYELSCFCWGENKRRKIVLQALVDTNDSCPKGTYQSADKARDKMDYFKL